MQCTVELLVLGCRNLQPVNLKDPSHPKVKFSLPGKGVNTIKETAASSLPNGSSPNYQQKVILPVNLPIDPLYAPALSIFVVEEQYFSNPVLGSTSIQLHEHCKLLPKNKQHQCGQCADYSPPVCMCIRTYIQIRLLGRQRNPAARS